MSPARLRCVDLEAELVPHARGELDLLPAARMDAHLARCPRCRAAATALERGLDAARAWTPEVSPAELDRMIASVAPVVPAVRPWPRVAAAAALAAGLTLAIASAAWRAEPVVVAQALEARAMPSPAIEPARAAPDPPPEPPAPQRRAPGRVRRSELARGVRAITSAEWDGRLVERSPNALELTATRGYAVLSFEGGKGRTLRIRAPDLEVEVVGTQLFVEVTPGRPTTVGVIDGKVDVHRGGVAPTRLQAGSLLRADRAAPSPIARAKLRSGPYHADAYLGAHVRARVLDVLASIEGLVREGRLADAEEELRMLLPVSGGARAHVAFELARLVSRDPARWAEAERRLAELASSGGGEIQRQAALLRCELTIDRVGRCDGARCLRSLGTAEALRVLERTRLTNEPCGS